MVDHSAITANDSSFVRVPSSLLPQFTRLSKRGAEGHVLPPRTAQDEQQRQLQKVHEAEIEELKQSLTYVEIQLARAKQETEALNAKVNEQQAEIERGHENLAKQLKANQQQAKQIADLQATINGFNQNQRDVSGSS